MSGLHGLATKALRGLDPEDAHGLAVLGPETGPGAGGRPADDPILATELAGGALKLPNPVGLAPGFDKNAEVFAPMLRAGFGFVECGTVTPLPQAGNPRPRLFRLSEDRAVINRMGFNNQGLDAFAGRLARRGPGAVGANFGANKDSRDRIGDYVTGLTRLWGLAEYYTVNISSPNTPGLRALQTRAALEELLGRVVEAAGRLPAQGSRPIFLKVAPDLEDGEVEAICEVVAGNALSGVIVSNTTVSRPAAAFAPTPARPAASPARRSWTSPRRCCGGSRKRQPGGSTWSASAASAREPTPTPRSAPERPPCSSIRRWFSRARAWSPASSAIWLSACTPMASNRSARPLGRNSRRASRCRTGLAGLTRKLWRTPPLSRRSLNGPGGLASSGRAACPRAS